MNNIQSDQQWAQFVAQLKKDQFYNDLHWEPYSRIIPKQADGGIDEEIEIKSDFHFKVEYITGNFTTLIDDGQGAALDDGTNHITLRVLDNSTELKLFRNPVALDLFLSPGRVLSSGIAGDPSGHLIYPIPFVHIFGAKGGIQLELRNNSDWENTVNLLFMGRALLNQRVDSF
jgi:hypothetical protein